MAETVTITIPRSVGYSGKGGRKSYIAKIGGSDQKYIFSREFVGTEATDTAAMFKVRRKGKGSWTEAAAIGPGLYEVCEAGEKTFVLVWLKDSGDAAWCNIGDARAVDIAVLMDQGQSFEEARKATKPPPKVEEATAK